jgi:hypothetical protein
MNLGHVTLFQRFGLDADVRLAGPLLLRYFFTQVSKLLPAAVSRPVNSSRAICAYEIVILSLAFFGKSRTRHVSSDACELSRSNTYPSTFEPSLRVIVTSPR